MSDANDLDRLYDLLPAIHRMRDAEQLYPLRALLRLLGREAQVLEDDITRLYESWFIETCPDWVVPYIGELVGYMPVVEAGDPANLDVSDPQGRGRVLIPRSEVANTVRYRRRKGTLALLEDLARDAAGWPARAVEFFEWLLWTQNLNHRRPGRGGTADLRAGLQPLLPGSTLNRWAHTADMRRPVARVAPGYYNIPAVGLFAWRLRPYSVTHSRAYNREEVGQQAYTFSGLGNDTQLFNHPAGRNQEGEPGTLDLPAPITRRAFEQRLPRDPQRRPPIQSVASPDYYGLQRSLAIWAQDWPVKNAPQPIPRESVIPADLSQWRYRAPRNYVAVDPQLGRFVFPPGQSPTGSVHVSYSYGFAAPIGGGEYARPLLAADGAVMYRVGQDRPGAEGTIGEALAAWRRADPRPRSAVVEIIDSDVYTEQLRIRLDSGETLQIRAASGARPIIRLLNYAADRPDPFSVEGGRGSSITLDGLLLAGRGLAIRGPDPREEGAAGDDLCQVVIRHCTLVPGWELRADCEPARPAEPSVEMLGSGARLKIEHSILGSILVEADRAGSEPLRLDLSDTILDATDDCDRPECAAITAPDGLFAHAVASFRRCTVFGRVKTHAIQLAENSIFTGEVRVARRQIGCMRFCYVPSGSRTPARHRCQPDALSARLDGDQAALEAERLRPQFMSNRYGTPSYARLADSCADEIRQGADDQSEMGVYHDLYEPQRTALLRRRLEEMTPAGMDTGIIFST